MVKVTQDTAGVITFASEDYCIVSVGQEYRFVFSQSKLYSSGSPCRGDMARTLKEGVKVNLCYDLSEPNQPVVRAVWVGKRPALFAAANISSSSHIYNQQGFVIEETGDSFLVKRDYGGRDTVLVNKRVIYELGRNALVSVVKFDAVPFQFPHSSGASFRANCAWIGENQPKLVDRFGLETEESQFGETQFEGQIVRGTVVVIPNDIVAFAHVDVHQGAIVMLLCSSFKLLRNCRRMRDLVCIGDVLFMRVRLGLIVPGRWQLYAERAWKDGERYDEPEPNLGNKRRIEAPVTPDDNVVPKSFDKPAGKLPEKNCDVLYADPPLRGKIYPNHDKAEAAFISFGDLKIGVKRTDVFIEGVMSTVQQFRCLVDPGENILSFEAIPTVYTNVNLTHDATCVWLGRKPSLEDVVSSVHPRNFSLLRSNRTFYGQVCKYYLPNFAILSVKKEQVAACLHVSVFGSKDYHLSGKFITNFANWKQRFEFRLKNSSLFPDVVCAYEAKPCTEAEMKRGLATAPAKELSSAPDHCGSYVYEVAPFTKKWPLRGLLLNFSGVLEIVSKTGKGRIKVEHDFGTSLIDMDDSILRTLKNNEPMDLQTLKRLVGRPVCFDIEQQDAEAVVQRIWLRGSSRPPPECSVSSQLGFKGNPTFSANLWYSGTIISVPLNDAAIAQVSGVPVLVTLEALVAGGMTKTTPSIIDVYLKVNDLVALTVKHVQAKKGSTFFKAVVCMSARRIGKSSFGDKFEVTKVNRNEMSWSCQWKGGEINKKARVIRENGCYYLSTKSSVYGSNLKVLLDREIFVDGVSTPIGFDLEGMEVTCHIGRVFEEKDGTGNLVEKRFVACAWVGEKPPPAVIKKENLAVPEGLVCSNSHYVGTVESFPLPTYALCRVGLVPVLVMLSEIKISGEFVTVRESALKRGEQVSMCINEKTLDDYTYLLGSNILLNVVQQDTALINVHGTVTSLPRPTGEIRATGTTDKSGGIRVSFELCVVMCTEKSVMSSLELSSWFGHITKILACGTKVIFSAMKISEAGGRFQYRAYEVRMVC